MAKKRLNRKRLNPKMHVYTGSNQSEPMKLQLFNYNKDSFKEEIPYTVDKFKSFPNDGTTYWLNFHGLHEVDQITLFSEKLGVHQLVVQDILDINQRPKFQEYDDYWFFSIKSILPSTQSGLELEQLSFVLGPNYLVSFQEKEADYFQHVRERIRNNMGIIRERGADYLLFLLLESILDNYFKTVNNIEDIIENLKFINAEKDPTPELLKTIEVYKRQIHLIKKTLIPIRDFLSKIDRDQAGLILEKHQKYFNELKDLCLSLIDDTEQIEIRLESNTNLFFSVQSHRMNQVMKTLTVVATIFIPLTFVAGIYGMNFVNIPELSWKYGYFGFWGVIFLIFLGMMYFFRKKKWF